MMNQMSGQVQSLSGYMEVKLPKANGNKFKAWENLWVVLRPMADMTTHQSIVVTVFMYTDKEASTKPFANKSTLLLDSVTSITRAKYRSHPFSFSVNCGQPLVYFSARSESDSQKWMLFLRHIYWPPVLILEPKCEFYEVSIIDNIYSEKLGLSGNYWLRVQLTSLKLYDIRSNRQIQEWKIETLRRFYIASSEIRNDTDKVLVVQAGAKSRSGEGDLMLFSPRARKIFDYIHCCIQEVIGRNHSNNLSGSPVTSNVVLRNIIGKSSHLGRIGSTISDDSVETRSSSSRGSIPFQESDGDVPTCSCNRLSATESTTQEHVPKTMRSTSLVDSDQSKRDVAEASRSISRSNSCSRELPIISPPRTQLSPLTMAKKDIAQWIDQCDPLEHLSPTTENDASEQLQRKCDNRNVCSDELLRNDLYEAMAMLGMDSNSTRKLRYAEHYDVISNSTETCKKPNAPERLSLHERQRKVSSDSSHLIKHEEISNELEKMNEVPKSKSTGDVHVDTYDEVQLPKRAHKKNLESFFGTGDYKSFSSNQPSLPRVIPPTNKPHKSRVRINPGASEKPPELPERPMFLSLREIDKNKRTQSPDVISPISSPLSPLRIDSVVENSPVESDYADLWSGPEDEREKPILMRTRSEMVRPSITKRLWGSKKDKLPDLPKSQLLRSTSMEVKHKGNTKNRQERMCNSSNFGISPDPLVEYQNMNAENEVDADLLFKPKQTGSKKSIKKTNESNSTFSRALSTSILPIDQELQYEVNDKSPLSSHGSFLLRKVQPSVDTCNEDQHDSGYVENFKGDTSYYVNNKQTEANSNKMNDLEDDHNIYENICENYICDQGVLLYDDTNAKTEKSKPPPEVKKKPKRKDGISFANSPTIIDSQHTKVNEKFSNFVCELSSQINRQRKRNALSNSLEDTVQTEYDVPTQIAHKVMLDYDNVELANKQNNDWNCDDDYNESMLSTDYENIYIDMSGRCIIRNADGTETHAGSV